MRVHRASSGALSQLTILKITINPVTSEVAVRHTDEHYDYKKVTVLSSIKTENARNAKAAVSHRYQDISACMHTQCLLILAYGLSFCSCVLCFYNLDSRHTCLTRAIAWLKTAKHKTLIYWKDAVYRLSGFTNGAPSMCLALLIVCFVEWTGENDLRWWSMCLLELIEQSDMLTLVMSLLDSSLAASGTSLCWDTANTTSPSVWQWAQHLNLS